MEINCDQNSADGNIVTELIKLLKLDLLYCIQEGLIVHANSERNPYLSTLLFLSIKQ